MSPKRVRAPARTIIGVVEEVTVRGPAGDHRVKARVDTGAKRTTIDTDLAKAAGFGPVLRRVKTRAAAAERPEERDVVRATVIMAGKAFDVDAAITDRKDMHYPVIVGMDVLASAGFLVNPRKSNRRGT